MDKRISKYFGITQDEWLMCIFETAYMYLGNTLVYYDENDHTRTLHTDYDMIRVLTCAPGGMFWEWWQEAFEQMDVLILQGYERLAQKYWDALGKQQTLNEYKKIHSEVKYYPPASLTRSCYKNYTPINAHFRYETLKKSIEG